MSVILKGTRNIKDIVAPCAFDFSNEDFSRIGTKYCRSFVMNGFPNEVHVKWLDGLFNYNGDMDTAIYVHPTDERVAIDELTKQITKLITQESMERDKGSIKLLGKLQDQIADLEAQRARLERNTEKLFHVAICSNLYSTSETQLKKESEMLDKDLRSRNIVHIPLYLRQRDAYKSALPFGNSCVDNYFRNLNTGSLTACFPFYNSEISHKSGIFHGINLSTKTPIYIDYYNRKLLVNGNIICIGTSGAGKTYTLTTLTMRSIIKGIKTTVIDPEGEYVYITKALGGKHITIAPESKTLLNPFDLESEEIEEEALNEHGERVMRVREEVQVNEKISDILNLLSIIFESNNLPTANNGLLSSLLQQLYKNKGFTREKESLYEINNENGFFDEETGVFVTKVRKPMPTFSEFHDILTKYYNETNDESLKPYIQCLRMFRKDGIYGMFDGQTSKELDGFEKSPLITFDISQIEDKILRPIGMYIALSWTWEKFGKKNIDVKKRVICDEAWMLLETSMPGSEQAGSFLNTLARRFRKRTGGLLVASQSLMEFKENKFGKAILNNSATKIFMKQDAKTIQEIKNDFALSDGEANFLIGADKGQMLIKMEKESTIGFNLSFDFEQKLIESAKFSLGKTV